MSKKLEIVPVTPSATAIQSVIAAALADPDLIKTDSIATAGSMVQYLGLVSLGDYKPLPARGKGQSFSAWVSEIRGEFSDEEWTTAASAGINLATHMAQLFAMGVGYVLLRAYQDGSYLHHPAVKGSENPWAAFCKHIVQEESDMSRVIAFRYIHAIPVIHWLDANRPVYKALRGSFLSTMVVEGEDGKGSTEVEVQVPLVPRDIDMWLTGPWLPRLGRVGKMIGDLIQEMRRVETEPEKLAIVDKIADLLLLVRDPDKSYRDIDGAARQGVQTLPPIDLKVVEHDGFAGTVKVEANVDRRQLQRLLNLTQDAVRYLEKGEAPTETTTRMVLRRSTHPVCPNCDNRAAFMLDIDQTVEVLCDQCGWAMSMDEAETGYDWWLATNEGEGWGEWKHFDEDPKILNRTGTNLISGPTEEEFWGFHITYWHYVQEVNWIKELIKELEDARRSL